MTVEAAYLVPVTVLLTMLLIFYSFCEHDRVWYMAAACEAALFGTAATEEQQESERRAVTRGQERMEEQPFPVLEPPVLQVTAENRKVIVSYASEGSAGFASFFPYKAEGAAVQEDPEAAVRTAWIAKKLMNGG